MSKNRILASLISNDTSKVKSVYTDSDNIVTSASLGVTAAAGTAIYSSADTLPVSATNGDQALVTSTNRLYIYSNGGWYNIALINTTPYWSVEASTTYDLSTTGGSTGSHHADGDSLGGGRVAGLTVLVDSPHRQDPRHRGWCPHGDRATSSVSRRRDYHDVVGCRITEGPIPGFWPITRVSGQGERNDVRVVVDSKPNGIGDLLIGGDCSAPKTHRQTQQLGFRGAAQHSINPVVSSTSR